jgi:hypothetical protein
MPKNTPYGRAAKYLANVSEEYASWDASRTPENVGQFYGALFQGRRYDKNGNLITKQTKKKK